MKTRRIFTAVFLTICMLAGNVSPAFAMPPLPSSIYGSVLVNGENAPAGTIVSAWINGVKYSQATVNLYSGNMYYSLDVPGDDPAEPGIQGGVEGDTIVFKIGDLTASETGVWHSGTNQNVNLSVFLSFPPVITEGNSVPVTMSEDGAPTAFSLTLNATDANGDVISWSIGTPAGNGTASASGTGTSKVINYTPTANYYGTDSFVVQVSDGTESDTITVNLTIDPINDAPVANNQGVSTLENTPRSITLVGTDVENAPLDYFIVALPTHGTLSGVTPNLTYTPAANYDGTDSFNFKVSDGELNSNTATVTITVDLVNVAPVCSAVSLNTDEDTTGQVAPSCTDGDGDALTYSIVGEPAKGAADVVAGMLQYAPAANTSGTDSFTYRAFDGLVYSNLAIVNVTVTPINDAPVANPQSLATNEDTPLAITLTGSDIDSGTLTFAVTVDPLHGTLTGSGANRTYTPFANYYGPDSFAFRANDGSLNSAPAVITITVDPVNDTPVAVADSYGTPEDTALTIAAPGVLSNDLDADGDTVTAIKVANPANGSVTLNANGSFTYTPNAFFNGSDSFTYKVNDGHVDGNTVTVTINVSSVNNAPSCSPVSLSTAEDTNGQADPSCTDADNNPLTYGVVGQPSHGTASVVAGKLVFIPELNYFGPDSFTYKASDSLLDSVPTAVSVTVSAVNDLPTISDSTNKSTNEDTSTGDIAVTVGDVETVAGSLTVTATSSNITLVPNGNISLGGSGANRTLNIAPALNQFGTTTITVTVNDGTVSTNDTFVLTVNAVNDLPTISNITDKSTNEDTAIGNIAFTVGDVETAATSLNVTVTSSNATLVPNGNITLGGSGSSRTINLAPASDQTGTTTITVTVSDGTDSTSDTFGLTVHAVNDLPTISNITDKSTNEDTATGDISFTVGDVETAAGSLTVSATSSNTGLVPNGNILLGGSGASRTLNITPVLNQSGTTTITITVDDGDTGTASDTFVLTVVAVNDLPTISDITDKSTAEDTSTGSIAFTVGDVETAVGSLTVTATSSNTTLVPNGNITLGGSGANRTISILPASDKNGTTTITVTVNDSIASTSDTFVLTVTAVNDAPAAVSDAYATPEDTTLNVPAPGVLSNDSDVDGNPITAVKVTDPAHGTLILNANGSFTYVPTALYHGTDSFTYKAKDSTADSNTVTVTINVSSVNNPPVAVDDTFTATEDTARVLPITGAGSPAANDTDLDLDTLTVTAVSAPVGGTVSLGSSIIFTPTANLCGTGAGKFNYTVSDGNGGTDSGLVTLDIACVNDAPVANAQSVNATEDTALPITLTGSDIDGDSLTYVVTINPTHGILSGTAPNLTYTPALNYNGPDTFTFKVNDSTVDSAPAVVTINVAAVNDAPVANDQPVTTNEDTAKAITLTGSDVDTGTILTYTVLTQPANGTLSGTAPSVTYTPNANFNGTDSFTFRVSDGTLNDMATISITVDAVNDAPAANNQSVTTNEDAAKAITLTGSDVDAGTTLTFTVVANPTHGILSGTAPDLTYTPVANYNGPDTFTFKVNDGTVDSATATVTIIVTSVNDAPVANDQSVTTNEDTTKAITLTGSDVDAGAILTYNILTQPANGTLTGSAPNVTYTPDANFHGSDSFTLRISDGTANSNTATVSITVTAVNDVPVADPQAVSTNEDTAKNITLTGSDVETGITFTVVTNPIHGTLSGTAPNLTYIPAANYFGADSFTFKVNDGTVDSATATVNITVVSVNDVPTANPQSVTTNEDTSKAITLTGSDVESTITFAIVTGPAHGTLTGTAPAITYTPNANYFGSDSFTFKVNDGTVDSAPATVSITVTSVNDAPVAVANVYATPEDTTLNVPAPGVLVNDSDIEGDALTAVKVSNPAHGSLTFNADGSFSYTPNALFNGSDSFTYKANDGLLDSNIVTVTINVDSINNAPVCSPVSLTTPEDINGQANPSCTDADGNSLEYSIVAQPIHGTASVVVGKLVYAPAANYNGTDSFTYKANDGTVDSNTATVSVTVTPVNDVPVANEQSVTTNEDTAKSITLTGSDVESSVTFTLAAGPAHGALTGTAPNLTYTPAANYNGPDSFTFKVNDGIVDGNTATVSITVTPVNDTPVANDQAVTTNEDTAKAITLTGSDVDTGTTLTYTILTQPANGTLSGTAPNVTYTPTANFNGSDSFTFRVSDGTLNSTGTVSITVTPVNDAPLANNQSVTTNEDAAKAITLTGSDVDTGTTLTYTILTQPAHGTLSGSAPTVTYTPNANYNGTDSFTFRVSDGTANSNTATVSITVTAVNDVPVANDQSVTTNEDTAKAITLTGSDIENAVTFVVVAGPLHGSLTGTVPNLTYIPAANYNGSDSFTFKVNDGSADSNIATVSITVTPINDAPSALSNTYSTPEDTTLNVPAPGVLANDSDIEGSTLSAVKVTNPSHGTVTLNLNGSFTYVPTVAYNGSDSFTYKANDGSLDSNIVTVTINISSVNNAPVAVDDTFTAPEDTAKTFPVTGAGSPAANDTDVDGDTLTVASVSNPTGGTVSLVGSTVTFTPTANLCGMGVGSFEYVVSDGHGGVDTGLVTLNITCVNDAPVANNQSVSTNEDTAKAITLTGSDVENGTLTFTVLTQPAHGTLSGSAPNVTYTPAANYTGSDSFTFRISDGTLNSNIATVTITVSAVNDTPVANAQSVTTAEDTAKAITLTGSDVENGTLTYIIVAQPTHGTLSGIAPNVTYTPAANYNGPDSFTFQVNDGTANSNTATVTINVTAVNDAPVANAQSVTTNEDTAKTITLTGSDVENGTLTYTIVIQPAHGTLTGTAPNVTYTPAAHYFGTDSFTFKVNDGTVDSGTAIVSITVVPNEYTFTVTTVGNGSVTRNPAKATYHYGETVHLTAVADAGWQFSAWSGALTGAVNPQSITVTGNTSITATFIETGMQKPGVPQLLAPSSGSSTLDTTPWFDWKDSDPAAAYYRIQVAVSGFFILPVIDQTNIPTSEFTPSVELVPGLVYFWRVQAYNSAGEASGWSSIRYFKLIPQTPVLIAPVNNEHIMSLRPDFDWSSVPGVGYYTIQVSKNNTFTQLVMANASLDSDFTARKDLPSGKTLYWRVRAESFAGASAWSPTWSFRTPNPPGVPVLISPKYGSVTSNVQPAFKWSKVSVPLGTNFDHYEIQVDTNTSFDLPVIDMSISGVNSTNYQPTIPLASRTQYFWRVRAVNTDGESSSWSNTWMFTTPRPSLPRWRTGTYSASGAYVSWESRYSVDEAIVAPVLTSTTGGPLNWSDVPNATGYMVQIATEPTFSSAPLLTSATTMDSEYTILRTLTPGATLYWRVLAIRGDSVSNWSETFSIPMP